MVASLAEKHEQACTLPAGLPRLCDGDSGYVPQGEILADVPSSRGVLCFAKPHAHGDLGRQMRGAKMSVRVEGAKDHLADKEGIIGAGRERGLRSPNCIGCERPLTENARTRAEFSGTQEAAWPGPCGMAYHHPGGLLMVPV